MEPGTEVRAYGQPAPDHTSDAESLAGLYAFGALDGAELARFERHLADCGRCAEVVDGDLAIVSTLSLSVPEVEATPGFKERLLERAAAELATPNTESASPAISFPARRQSTLPLTWLLPVAALIVALLAGAGLMSQQITAVQVTKTALLENSAPGGRAEVFVRASGEGVIQLQGFENLQGGRVYQAWVIRPGSQPLATGASTSGNGTLTLDGDIRGVKVAVTVEPGRGARAPSVQPFVIGDAPL